MSKRPKARSAIKFPRGWNVHRTVSRGREYFHHHPGRGTKRAGLRTRLPDDPYTPEFMTALRQAQGLTGNTTPTDTVSALIDAYIADWPKLRRPLAESTQKQYRRQLENARERWGELLARGLKPLHVRDAVDRRAATPGAANVFLGTMCALSKWARGKDLIDASFTEGVEGYASKGGHKPWTAEQIACAHEHLKGDVRKGVFLMMYTGQRGSDVVRLGPTMIDDGGFDLGWRGQIKTGVRPWMPIFPELAAEMATWDRKGELGPYVRRPNGKPYSRDDFGRAFAEAKAKLAERGITALAGTTLHGLRGTACVRLRDEGEPDGVIAALVGMSTRMVERYTRFADRKATGKAAVLRIEERRRARANETAPATASNCTTLDNCTRGALK